MHRLQGGIRTLAEYDVESGCCLAAVDLPVSPATLAYSPDGNLLVALLQDRSVLAFYGGGLADRSVLLPGSGRTERVHQGFHITVTAVSTNVNSVVVPRPSNGPSTLRSTDLLRCCGRVRSRLCSCPNIAAAA